MNVSAQFSKPELKLRSDSERYIYPINPGKPGSLAGTMGELRSTHFHSGIDIRTNNMIGFPVLASKSGYISRITMGPSGYGNIIYIKHPDGNTTLYAHLDKFMGPLAEYVLNEQYQRQTSEIDLNFRENQFTVKQGDTIALSGNSGSSSGPHLHFDIRDPQNYALDPLKVAHFPEVAEKLPPAPEKIALRTLDRNARINDRFGRFEFHAASRVGNNYSIASPILASGTIGLEIIAKDRLAPKSPFFGGVNDIEVRVDSQLVFSQAIDKVDITETRAIYTLMDFKTMRNKGTRFYKLYIDDGNELKFYGNSPGSGKITVNPNKESLVQITMKDSYGNTSTVSFKMKPSPVVKDVITLEAMTSDVLSDIHENILMVTARPCKDSTKARIFIRGEVKEIEPDYANANRAVYLIDLRKTVPDSVVVCGKSVVPEINISIPSGTDYRYYGDRLDIQFPKQSIYDTLYLRTAHWYQADSSEVFSIGDRTIPLHKSIDVTLKPEKSYAWDKSMGIYRLAGRGYTYIGGEWSNGRIHFSTREFGDFTILKDLVPPVIKVVNADRSGARFKIRDNLSGIDKFDAYINGQWLLMHYDAKTATIWSERQNKKVPLTGTLELVVTDNAGNKSTFVKKIL
jgi:hypothetical protein